MPFSFASSPLSEILEQATLETERLTYYAGRRSQPASWIRERIPSVFFLGVKNCLLFLTFPYPVPVPKKLCDFYWLQLRITCKSGWIAQAEKKNTATAKEGSLLRRGGQSQGCALTYGALSPEATKTWPRATENIVQVSQPGDMLVLVSWFKVARSYLYACWLCFWFAFFRMKHSTDFYDFFHP